MIFAKKKTKSFYTSICIVLTMLIVLSLAITLIGNSNTDNITQADTIAGSPAASVLNLSANGGEKDNFSSLLSGAQNEYIYFGTKSGSAIKWRVLSNNDTKYSNGSILLWSDSSLGSEQYNPYSDNPNYAYWGTSKIRAMLNSGTYLSTVSNDAAVPSFNQPVAEDNSFLYKSFDKNERNSIVKTKEYETKLWGFDGKATPAFKTTGIVGSSSGQYDSSNVNNVAGTYASVVNNTSVVEKTSEDSLFLLDYYDINNDSYGFVDSDGKTYANKVIPSWTSSSAGYPGYNDNGNNGSITANYLKDGEVDYFLRSVGRISASSYIIFVNASVGHVSSYQVSSTYGVRPAFNLNPSSVIYATAASVASNEAVFAPVNSVSASEGKPAYKVYFKADSYINFNDSTDLDGVPEIFPANGTIKVKKSGQSGSVVILLADKTGDGSVAYQATASFNDGVATATLPSGVKAKDYNITVLFADSIKGGEFAESITGSYTYQGLAIPKNVSVEYNGAQRTVGDFSSEEWYDSSIYADSSIMTVVIPTAINVNTYTVSFTIKDTADVEWIGGNKGKKEITLTITSKPLGVSWSTSEEGIAVPSLIDSQLCSNASGVKDTVKLNLNYTGRNSNAGYDSTTVPRVIGDYTVTITSLSNSNYTLDETAVDSQDFTKTETNIPVPTFFPKSSYNYNGSVRTYELELGGDFKGDYTVHVPTDFTGKYDLNKTVTTDGMVTVKATNAGTYELEVRLTDPQNTQWKLSNGTVTKDSQKLQFKILPLPLELQIVTDTNTIDCELGEDFDLYVQAQTRPKLGESVLLDFYVQRVGSESETLVYSNFEFDSTMSDFTIKLKLSEVEIPSNYKLVIKVKNKDGSSDYVNYETILDDIIFNIKEKVDVNSTIFWQLRINGAIKTSMYFDIDIDYTPKFDKIPLVYSGKEYSFTASLPSGYSVDRTYSVDGYTNGYKDAKFTNAGEYTTTARVNTPDGTKEYSIKWTIEQAKFDLSNVKWQYDGQLPYDKVNGSEAILDPKALPAGLVPNYFNNTGTTVGTSGSASVTFTLASGYEGNYVLPDESDKDSYVDSNDDFEWSKPWNVVKATIQSSSWKNSTATDSNNHAFSIPVLRDPNAEDGIVEYEYYETDSMGNILDANNPLKKSDIVWSESEAKFYIAKPILQDTQNYQLDNPNSQSKVFRVGKELAKVSVSLEKTQVEYNTNPRHAKVKVADSALPTTAFDLIYYDGYTRLSNAPTEVGKYRVEVSLKNTYMDRYQIDGDYEFDYEIVKAKISTDWNENAKPPVLKLTYGQVNGVEYEIIDSGENLVEYKNLKAGVTYKIRARIKDNQLDKFIFDDDSTETDWKTFSVTANDLDNLKNPDSPDNPAYPQKDPELPTQDEDPTDPNGPGSGNVPGSGDEGGSGSLGDIIEKLKDIPLWQLIASVISIILIIVFLSKTAGYESKRKKFNKKANKLESSVYAGAFLGLAMSGWTAIACVLMALAVMSFVMMMIAKSRLGKAEEAYEDELEEYNRNKKDEEKQEARQRDENLRMMFMGMGNNGAMAQGMPQGYAYQQPAFGIDEMRGLISETVTALLPGVQQLLPQQASSNDEVIKSLVEEQKAMRGLMERLTDQPDERVVEREVAATSVNDETIKQMMKNQEMLMEKILELSANQQQSQVQVIEKEVPVEKIVEKVVEVPVEVEKIVEKEVVKEVPVEVEKIVEKEVVKKVKVEVPVAVPASRKPKKEVAPRLTLDEAYAKLSKQQQKYFDGLKQYALSKQGCKEKKSTYFIVIGQSIVNPLLKLTIKKDTTVALFKMEDEYMKDIRKDATNDGTKIKVKETEVVISDAQACKAAKNMIDLREDQIERYQDLLKEQRALKNKK